MAEKVECSLKTRESSVGGGLSRPSGNILSSEQSERTEGPQMKRKRSSTNCHQCHRNDRGRVLQCNKCKKRYCTPCINTWYPKIEEASFTESCPICHNICNCGACLQSKRASKIQDFSITCEDRFYFSNYIIRVLLPSLKAFVAEKNLGMEKDIIQDDEVLELLARAEAIAELDKSSRGQLISEGSCSCLTNGGSVRKASSREEGNENYLYCPLPSDTEKSDLQHFQFHFSKGQPIIVCNALSGIFGFSWEPTVLERALLISGRGGNNSLDVSVMNCFNWSEENINIHKFFEGYSKGIFDSQGYPKILKLENWPSSDLFQKQLPRHYAELIRCLPFKHYTHPGAGCLNIPVKLPMMPMLNLGPQMCVSYGPYGVHQGSQWDSITNLQYAVSDRVSIMMHIATITYTNQQISTLEKLQGLEDPEAGTVWDVFRKQDIPKLGEYLRQLSEIVRPIHEQTVYLTVEHKRKLKDEYGIEPWTFVQKLGDAVFIPAGCPHQMRNLKSCIHVAVDFVSPESLAESNQLFKTSCFLSPKQTLKEDESQAKKMTILAIRQAVEDSEKILKFPSEFGGEVPSLAFFTQQAKMMRLILERKGCTDLPPATRSMLANLIRDFLNKYEASSSRT